MEKEINYNNYKKINKYLKTVFLALNDETYIGVFEKQTGMQISILPFPDIYDLKDFEITEKFYAMIKDEGNVRSAV